LSNRTWVNTKLNEASVIVHQTPVSKAPKNFDNRKKLVDDDERNYCDDKLTLFKLAFNEKKKWNEVMNLTLVNHVDRDKLKFVVDALPRNETNILCISIRLARRCFRRSAQTEKYVVLPKSR
jgi:hypothetical protein